jgi:tetratricopeptide (TPR) repeat protein
VREWVASASLPKLRSEAERLMRARSHGDESIAVNVRILELDPEDQAARTRLGFAYRVAEDFDSAERVYRQILAGRAGSWTATAERALRLIEIERVQGRPKTLDELLESVVNANDARVRAAAARDAGRLEVAARWADRAVALAERQGRAAMKRALTTQCSIVRRLGDSQRAVSIAERAVALDPDYAENGAAFRTLAAALVDDERVDEALEIARRHLEPDVEDAYAQNTAGRVYRVAFAATGEEKLLVASERCYRRAAELGEGSPEPLRALREIHDIHARAGRRERAAELAQFLLGLGHNIRVPTDVATA